MNARERVLEALAHKQPDKVPIDIGGHRSSSMAVQAYRNLRAYLGLEASELYVYDFIQQLAIVERDVQDILKGDVLDVGHDFCKNPAYWKPWRLQDGTACKIPSYIDVREDSEGWKAYNASGVEICIQKPGCLYFEQTCFPLMDSDSQSFDNLPEELDKIMWCSIGVPPAPAGFDEAGLRVRRDTAKALKESTDRAIYSAFGGNLIEIGEFAFRIDNFLCEIAADPKRVHRFLDKLVELHMENLRRYLLEVGNYIDVLGFGDDLGMQTGPQISPKAYQEFFKPRHKQMWEYAKKLAPHIKLCLHSCGGLYELLPDIIDAGMDAINPVQFTCHGMELGRLKKEFGRDITFWGGGCDTRDVLPNGTPQQVKDHVRRNLDVMFKDGGFVFQQVHNIMADVPPSNIVAMYEAANEYCG